MKNMLKDDVSTLSKQRLCPKKTTISNNFQARKNILVSIVMLLAAIIYSSASFAREADERYIYIGSEFGISDPVIKKFSHRTEGNKTRLSLKRSTMVGGRIGYSFYPDMMIELSVTHHPKFNMGYILPKTEQMPRTTHGSTKVTGNVFTLNLIYEIPQQMVGMKPYVIFGAGLAQMRTKETSSTTGNFGTPNQPFFKINKYKNNCFVWQAGLGMVKDLGNNFAIDFGAKLQVVNNLKFKYDKMNSATGDLEPQKPIKRTIGTGEFTVGLIYKIPV